MPLVPEEGLCTFYLLCNIVLQYYNVASGELSLIDWDRGRIRCRSQLGHVVTRERNAEKYN